MDEIILKIVETATAMTVAALAMLIMWKFMGQRTDPKLIELFETMTAASANRDASRDAANGRLLVGLEHLTAGLERNNDDWGAVRDSIGNLLTAFHEFISEVPLAHAKQDKAIDAIPGKILPSIDTLANELLSQAGNVNKMNNTVDNQSETIQQILAAVLRLEAQINVFQSENTRLGTKITNAQQELVSIKNDVSNLKPVLIINKEQPIKENENEEPNATVE